MSVPLSFLGVIIIWTTTPLAIKWSTQDAGFAFAVASRMLIGLFFAVLLITTIGQRLAWHREARSVYAFTGIGFSLSMISVYWAAQYLPSGWISLLFALSPIITGLLTAVVLKRWEFSVAKIVGLLLGIGGLGVIFVTGLDIGTEAALGIFAMLLSTTIYSYTAVKVEQNNAGLPPLTVTAGGLLYAMPLYVVAWLLLDGQVPQDLSWRSLASILYLGLFGSVLGFALFFYILRHVSAVRLSLITLITPVTALLLGNLLDDEPITLQVLAGGCCILLGLVCHEYGMIARRLWRQSS